MKAMRCSTLKGRSSWAVRMFFGGWFEHVIAARTKPIRTIWLLAAAPGALAQNEKAPPLAPSRKGGGQGLDIFAQFAAIRNRR